MMKKSTTITSKLLPCEQVGPVQQFGHWQVKEEQSSGFVWQTPPFSQALFLHTSVSVDDNQPVYMNFYISEE